MDASGLSTIGEDGITPGARLCARRPFSVSRETQLIKATRAFECPTFTVASSRSCGRDSCSVLMQSRFTVFCSDRGDSRGAVA